MCFAKIDRERERETAVNLSQQVSTNHSGPVVKKRRFSEANLHTSLLLREFYKARGQKSADLSKHMGYAD